MLDEIARFEKEVDVGRSGAAEGTTSLGDDESCILKLQLYSRRCKTWRSLYLLWDWSN
jgi:hypothetical protein